LVVNSSETSVLTDNKQPDPDGLISS